MRSISIAFALVPLAGFAARADGPIVVRAGLGVTSDQRAECSTCQSDTRWGLGFDTEIAYRVLNQLAFGVHAAITRNSYTTYVVEGPVSNQEGTPVEADVTSVQAGIGADWSTGRFWLAPWIGFDDRGTNPSERNLAYGLDAGADLYINRAGHRAGLYVDVTRTQGDDVAHTGNDLYLSAGVTYRYW